MDFLEGNSRSFIVTTVKSNQIKSVDLESYGNGHAVSVVGLCVKTAHSIQDTTDIFQWHLEHECFVVHVSNIRKEERNMDNVHPGSKRTMRLRLKDSQ